MNRGSLGSDQRVLATFHHFPQMKKVFHQRTLCRDVGAAIRRQKQPRQPENPRPPLELEMTERRLLGRLQVHVKRFLSSPRPLASRRQEVSVLRRKRPRFSVIQPLGEVKGNVFRLTRTQRSAAEPLTLTA